MQAVDYAKGHENNAVQALKICRKRRMCTSTVLSAMELRQPSRLPTTSSGDICMPACKLHKHQRVSSGLSHLISRVVWTRCGRRKSLSIYAAENCLRKRQQTLKYDLCKKARKGTLWFRPDTVLWNPFLNQRLDGIVINKNHPTLYILEFKRSSGRNEDFLRVK